MQVLTKAEVLKKIEDFCRPYASYSAAAKAIGCTEAQLSRARSDQDPVSPAILKKIGVKREPLYAIGVEKKHRDGHTNL